MEQWWWFIGSPVAEKFWDRVACRFIRALSPSLQFSRLCPPCVSALSQAGFLHGGEVALIISQSNTLPCSHLGIRQEQLPAVAEGKSEKGGSAWTTTAWATPTSTPETVTGWCASMHQSAPGKSQLTSQWESVEGHGEHEHSASRRVTDLIYRRGYGGQSLPKALHLVCGKSKTRCQWFCLQLAAFASIME